MSNHKHHDTHTPHEQEVDQGREYGKFVAILIAIAGISYYLHSAFEGNAGDDFIRLFMGVFFVVFALFKFIHLEEFPALFSSYDVIASRYRVYGYLYPFIQLFLGVLFLLNLGGPLRDLTTLAIGSISAYGVYKKVYIDKHSVQCACLGGVIKLPLSTVSLVEDAGMAVMALLMLIL
jgi:hypothetical protein